jgi:hypothetical protein
MEGGGGMLGIPDITILLAYILCVASAAACVIYGVVNWNRGGEHEQLDAQEEAAWENGEK